jgi:hypothetical protein
MPSEKGGGGVTTWKKIPAAVDSITTHFRKKQKKRFQLWSRVARCFISNQKIPIWVNFGGTWNKIWLYILCPFGIFYRHLGNFITILVHFVFIWYILCSFGTFFPVWVSCTKKIWQPCSETEIWCGVSMFALDAFVSEFGLLNFATNNRSNWFVAVWFTGFVLICSKIYCLIYMNCHVWLIN